MKEFKVNRYITVFRKSDELYEGEIEFVFEQSIDDLQKIFNISKDELMYDEFPIDERIARLLEPLIDCKLNLSKFSYFLSCGAV